MNLRSNSAASRVLRRASSSGLCPSRYPAVDRSSRGDEADPSVKRTRQPRHLGCYKFLRFSTAGTWLSWRRYFVACVLIAAGSLPAAEFDVVIRRGRLIDGTGNPWIYADVAIKGDRIAAVGRIPARAGTREIDATGLYVTPGFLDPHS